MVTDEQAKRLWQALSSGKSLTQSADKAGMDEKTARKYRRLGRLPSEVAPERAWRTREDPFVEVWPEVHELLREAPGLEAKSLFVSLQTKYPSKFDNTQLRSFQRGVKRWRATAGPAKEVFFSQVHHPGRLCASDFTHMKSLAVTIGGQPFDHLVYHWVLTYSNWESITICFSESFESLSEGLQNAMWELGGVPQRHRTDRMSLAVNNASSEKEFTRRYTGLLDYYGLEMEKIQPEQANENGDVEQSHRRFKEGVEQALLLRGHRDFESREAYGVPEGIGGRSQCGPPEASGRGVASAAASAGSAAGELQTTFAGSGPGKPDPRRPEHLFGSQPVDGREGRGAAVRGTRRGLVRPTGGGAISTLAWAEETPHQLPAHHRLAGAEAGAFENYVYREELFPTSRFRMAYDALREAQPERGHKEYLAILYLAARQSETAVDEALRTLLDSDRPVTRAAVEELVHRAEAVPAVTEVTVEEVDLLGFDDLFMHKEVWNEFQGGCEREVDGLLAGTALADVSGVF